MQAVIMAGGKGTQLHPLTTNVPKPMVPLFDRPVMEHCLRLLARHGITDIIVTVSHLARDVVEYFGDGSRLGVRIRYSVETEPLGTAGGVKRIQSMINGTFVVVSGDAITDMDITWALAQHRSASAIATIMLSEVDDPTQFGVVQRDPAGKVLRFAEKPRSTEVFSTTVSTGIYIMEPEVLSCIPYYEPQDFAREVFPRMLNNGEPVYAFPIPGYWCDVGNTAHYRNAHFDALEGRVNVEIPAAHIGQGIWMGERVELHNSAEVSAPVFLGAGVVVRRGAALGRRTVIGADSLVDEGAHIMRSVIGRGSLIGRNSRVSDCIVGSGYSVGDSEAISDRTLVEPVRYDTPVPEPVRTPLPKRPAEPNRRRREHAEELTV
jgi:mannose-1-phosphate guanylyltransferase/phosphomannomutase